MNIRYLRLLAVFLMCLTVFLVAEKVNSNISTEPVQAQEQFEEEDDECMQMMVDPNWNKDLDNLVIEEISKQSAEYGVDFCTAYKIAKCESRMDRYATNGVTGAKGVYQFLDSTWKFIKAPGHQYDFKENVHQFMIWYPLHPDWWECKK